MPERGAYRQTNSQESFWFVWFWGTDWSAHFYFIVLL